MVRARQTLILAIAGFFAVAAAAQLQVPPATNPAAPMLYSQEPAPISSDAPIGARDVLDIKVFQDPSFNGRVTVTDDGRITLPTLGKVDASGLTPPQLEQRIRGLLEAHYLAKADVNVAVLEAGSKPISVIGAVMRPGRIPATGNMTLIQAITNAGGLANGYGKDLVVLRTGSNGLTEQINIDIDDLLVRGNADLNLPLRPNDVINVAAEQPIIVYVIGEVMHPGKVQFRRSQTPMLVQAIADSGGTTDRAGRRVLLKRMVNGKETNQMVDLKSILSGKKADIQLLDNDTIVVRESFF
jgi:polysaccharide export outer membrane protein